MTEIIDCLFDSNNSFDIPNLRLDKQGGNLVLPFSAYGATKRSVSEAGTLHFYVDDYRFEGIWKNPAKVLSGNVVAVVEPNTSLFDTTPIAYGLQQIYKKRWIARCWQENGINVYADLNVSSKFYNYNRMGIPDGYNAFATRGYSDRLQYLEAEYEIAKEVSGFDSPKMIVYGGGEKVKEFCYHKSLLYVHEMMSAKKLGNG